MIVLESKSPRRRELLGMLGLEFTLASPSADETLPEGWMRISRDSFALGAEITLPQLPEVDGAYFTGWYYDEKRCYVYLNTGDDPLNVSH